MANLRSSSARNNSNQLFLMKTTTSLLIFAGIFNSVLFSQNNEQVRNRIEGTDRNIATEQISNSSQKSKKSPKSSSNDSGAQRPVLLSKSGVSSYFGYDTKYFYRSNPLATDGPAKQQATGMWTNTFYAGAGLGVFDLTDSVVTPYIGGSWTLNEYGESNLKPFNYNSTNAYALLLFQLGNGWAVRAGSSYANDRSADKDTEDYKEFFPNAAVMKTYSLNEDTTATVDLSFGKHIAESFFLNVTDNKGNTSNEKELSNYETAASLSFSHQYGSFLLIPKYRISYKSYDEGLNIDREDLSHDLGLKVDYPVTDALKASVFYSYSTRSTDGTEVSYDYKSYDTGLGLVINARF